MNDRFEKFTPRARKVLSLAQEEAQRFNHNYIGTEHLLLGLVREADSTAAKVLVELGIDQDRVRAAVEQIIGRGDRIVLGDIELPPRAKKVIELAVDESRRLNHTYIGTEHLLLGLLREGEGIAAGVLESLGVNLAVARQATLRMLDTPGGTPESQEAVGRSPSSLRLMGTQAHAVPPHGNSPAPMDMFDLFTARARQVLSLAQEEAQRLNHPYIGTEHLLLGLLREGDGVAAKVLTNLGVSLPEVRQKVEEFTRRGDHIVSSDIALSQRVRKVIKLALVEATSLNHTYIGTEHLLLGLANESEGIAPRVLASLGVTLEQVRTQTLQVLGRAGPFQVLDSALLVPPPMITLTFTPPAPSMTISMSFSGLDEGAQHVMLLAQAEAEHLHRLAVGDAHILLGLVLEGRSAAARALDQHGATIFAVRHALDNIEDTADIRPGQVGITPRARAILTNARAESTRHRAPVVTPEHLLLGLLTPHSGMAIAALRQLDIDPQALYAEVSQRTRDDRQADQPPE